MNNLARGKLSTYPPQQTTNVYVPCRPSTMTAETTAACPVMVRECVLGSRWLMAALTILLLLSTTVTCVHSTTVEHDFHIVHNVDNRSPEIDPFWYVGRGVRPIGRFGKRQSGGGGSGGLRNPGAVVSTLEILLNIIRNQENIGKTLSGEDADWLP
uniref:Prolactin releasing hormone 2 n=1 Tax=Hucho hucho TaxID=62062 RepID=A0A4W5NDC0_9TELE